MSLRRAARSGRVAVKSRPASVIIVAARCDGLVPIARHGMRREGDDRHASRARVDIAATAVQPSMMGRFMSRRMMSGDSEQALSRPCWPSAPRRRIRAFANGVRGIPDLLMVLDQQNARHLEVSVRSSAISSAVCEGDVACGIDGGARDRSSPASSRRLV